ncbi:MAG: hypothetical protein ACT4O1_16590 [Gemmatimonadota bacterium]
MFATIRRYRTIGPVDETLRRVRTEFVPQIQRIPGLISYSIIVAGETFAAISVYQDFDAAEESNRIAALWAKQASDGSARDAGAGDGGGGPAARVAGGHRLNTGLELRIRKSD